jgi:hypothetical protein
MSSTFASPALRFAQLRLAELAAEFTAGKPFHPSQVAGFVYRGTSLGLPAWVDRIAWKQFAKAFAGGRGWNIRVEQDGLDRPWRPRMRDDRPITFGHFAVVEQRGQIVLDYSVGRGLLRALRDPIVALDTAADTLLGRSLIQIGPAAIPTPSYFLLERLAPVTSAWAA